MSENAPSLYNLPIKLLCEDSQQIKIEIPIQEVTFSGSASQDMSELSCLGIFVGWVPSEDVPNLYLRINLHANCPPPRPHPNTVLVSKEIIICSPIGRFSEAGLLE